MMQKNEEELLNKWISYHSYLVGRKNLFVFDNGSTNEIVISQLRECQQRGINVSWDKNQKADFENKGTIFKDLITKFDQEDPYDFYIPLDCDEFLATLDDEGNISCDSQALKYNLLKYIDNDQLLMMDSQYYNSAISPCFFNKQPYRKCFFKKNTILQLDKGFHWGKIKTSENELRTNLIHVHFHNKPYNIAKEHAKEKLSGRVKNFDLLTLQNYNGSGLHLVRFFLETEPEYLRGQLRLNHIRSVSLAQKFTDLEINWPFLDDILESRERLKLIDENSGFSKILPQFRGSIDHISFVETSIKIKGWGVLNHSRPITNLFLNLGSGILIEFNFIERIEREDVNNMLNIKGGKIGFVAELDSSALKDIDQNKINLSLVTFIESHNSFSNFDFNRKCREFNFFALNVFDN